MAETARRLTEQGQAARVMLEGTTKPARGEGATLGFYSWGATDPEHIGVAPLKWFSCRAQSRRTSPARMRGRLRRRRITGYRVRRTIVGTFFAGSADTLTGDLIREGVTGVAGQVAEPYRAGRSTSGDFVPGVSCRIQPRRSLLSGDADTLSWTTIVVGDPLCRPFAGRILTSTDLESAIDATHGTAAPVLGATAGDGGGDDDIRRPARRPPWCPRCAPIPCRP